VVAGLAVQEFRRTAGRKAVSRIPPVARIRRYTSAEPGIFLQIVEARRRPTQDNHGASRAFPLARAVLQWQQRQPTARQLARPSCPRRRQRDGAPVRQRQEQCAAGPACAEALAAVSSPGAARAHDLREADHQARRQACRQVRRARAVAVLSSMYFVSLPSVWTRRAVRGRITQGAAYSLSSSSLALRRSRLCVVCRAQYLFAFRFVRARSVRDTSTGSRVDTAASGLATAGSQPDSQPHTSSRAGLSH
jgi:hypothetical protein